MNVLGYWLAIYCTVVLEEHFIFRKGDYSRYNAAEAWNKKALLPVGYAAVAAGCFGAAGAAVGMAQLWWTGPRKCPTLTAPTVTFHFGMLNADSMQSAKM